MTASHKEIIYDLGKQYQRNVQLLEEDNNINKENKEIIRKYVQDRLILGITKTRAIILIAHLRRIAHFIDKPLTGFTEEDIKALMIKLESKAYSESNKNHCKSILKNLLKSHDMPEKTLQWIKSKPCPSKLRPEDLLTEEDMHRMIATADGLMWKTMLSVLFETGIRPGELLGIRIKDCILYENKAMIYVASKLEKTQGSRVVYCYKSFHLIQQWLAAHPLSQT
jgi:integrase